MVTDPSTDFDYYEILGVPRDVSDDGLKCAYRKEALRWHPDKHSGSNRALAEEHFKKISEAYRVLSDPLKRAEHEGYDRQRYMEIRAPHVIVTKSYGWPSFNVSLGYVRERGDSHSPRAEPPRPPSPPAGSPADSLPTGMSETKDPFGVFRDAFGMLRSSAVFSGFPFAAEGMDMVRQPFTSCTPMQHVPPDIIGSEDWQEEVIPYENSLYEHAGEKDADVGEGASGICADMIVVDSRE